MLIFVLVATGLLSQFSSTLLLWDLKDGVVGTVPSMKSFPVGISAKSFRRLPTSFGKDNRPWLYRHFSSFPIFGEVRDGSTPDADLDDTGESIRALVPIRGDVDRSELKSFNGTVLLFGLRTTCMAPNVSVFNFNPDISPTVNITLTAPYPHWMNVNTLQNPSSITPFLNLTGENTVLARGMDQPSRPLHSDWDITSDRAFDYNYPAPRPKTGMYNTTDLGFDPEIRILYNVTYTGRGSDTRNPTWKQKDSQGPWVEIELEPNATSYSSIHVTVCVLSFMPEHGEAMLQRNKPAPEPTTQYNITEQQLNTSEVEEFLVPKFDNQRRPILNIEKDNWNIVPRLLTNTSEYPWKNTSSRAIFTLGMIDTGPALAARNLALCSACYVVSKGNTQIHGNLAAIFQSILRSTGSPAWALHGLWMLIIEAFYYDVLEQFDDFEEVSVEYFTKALIPSFSRGLTIV